jgi:hypothetical protein
LICLDTEIVGAARKHHDDAAYFRRRSIVKHALKLAACKRQVAHEHATLRRDADRFFMREFVVTRFEVGRVRSGDRKRTKRGGKEGRTEASSCLQEHVKPLDQVSSEIPCHPVDDQREDTRHGVKLKTHMNGGCHIFQRT